MKKTLVLITLSLLAQCALSQKLRDSVYVKNAVFEVVYSENLQQPKWLVYTSTNRATNVNRGSMDFYTEKEISTSDAQDYAKNEWDKGHLAPAATFSDNEANLKQTFSYLNCALQQQDLNRGEWRLLEEQERKWDDTENLEIRIDLVFSTLPRKVPTGATIPDRLVKHIRFEKSKKWQCFDFPNQKPTKSWNEHRIVCEKHK